MGYRYQNNLDDENERRYLESMTPLKRRCFQIAHWLFMLLSGLLAFYGTIGWLILKLF